eukprot:926966-Pleurochrysis_carterae.AAC.5
MPAKRSVGQVARPARTPSRARRRLFRRRLFRRRRRLPRARHLLRLRARLRLLCARRHDVQARGGAVKPVVVRVLVLRRQRVLALLAAHEPVGAVARRHHAALEEAGRVAHVDAVLSQQQRLAAALAGSAHDLNEEQVGVETR